MRIYLLRHEERDLSDPTFYSSLTDKGLDLSNKLKYTLDGLEIDIIFSSPFKRTLQTVKPFCDMTGTLVNIEYALYEKIVNHTKSKKIFDKDDFKMDLIERDEEYYLKNTDYVSFYNLEDIEFDDDGLKRSYQFLHHIISLYKETDYNILFVTHSAIMKNMINSDNFITPPMGGIVMIYDKQRILHKKINYVDKSVHFNEII